MAVVVSSCMNSAAVVAGLGPGDAPTLDVSLLDKVVNLCVRRGFVFRSADIYGGFRSAYDYGPLGVLLLRNIKDQWWRSIVETRRDVVGLDAAVLSPPAVWEASGHLDNFTDPMADCRSCGARHRLDKLADSDVCEACGKRGALTDPRQFNLMFSTHAGPVADTAAVAYLRPETAQGTFINFDNVIRSSRKTPPFGIAQIGKSFRNEITPGSFVFRTREFEQMELEYFVPPADAEHWYRDWIDTRHSWYTDLGIDAALLRLREHNPDERAHYATAATDIEFLFPWGWDELEGIADRGAYDLTCHAEASGQRLAVFDPVAGEHYVPHVIEPAAGATRAALAFLAAAYHIETVDSQPRLVLRLDHRLAPHQVAVLPLMRREPLTQIAREVFDTLAGVWRCDYDETQSIGKRYRRQDEAGTPLCVTVDFDTGADNSVTVRDRDTMDQQRVSIDRLNEMLTDRLT